MADVWYYMVLVCVFVQYRIVLYCIVLCCIVYYCVVCLDVGFYACRYVSRTCIPRDARDPTSKAFPKGALLATGHAGVASSSLSPEQASGDPGFQLSLFRIEVEAMDLDPAAIDTKIDL